MQTTPFGQIILFSAIRPITKELRVKREPMETFLLPRYSSTRLRVIIDFNLAPQPLMRVAPSGHPALISMGRFAHLTEMGMERQSWT